MLCGTACMVSVCRYYGIKYSARFISGMGQIGHEGMSLLGLSKMSQRLGFRTMNVSIPLVKLQDLPLPCILHWNQNHFVILYHIDDRGRYYICDPSKGLLRLTEDEFLSHWVGASDKGIAMLLEPTEKFGTIIEEHVTTPSVLRFVYRYIKEYKSYLFQIALGLVLGCLLQLAMPFLTQFIVDNGIKHQDIGLIWLILVGEMMIVAGRTATDFIRRWLLLHMSMRINISLVSDFFIKLMKLPMSFFESRLLGDLLQRVADHSRIQSFLTGQVLNVTFAILSFAVFGIVLLIYNGVIFAVFMGGSIAYALWIVRFLRQRKILDYETFEYEAVSQSKTYEMLSAMPEIKLQNCEKRRRYEWEDTQADLFGTRVRALKLQQIQETGAILINEIKNILITVLSATAVIEGEITLGMMLAIQYIVGQLNSPIEQLMSFVYSCQDMRISLERINEVHRGKNEESFAGTRTRFAETGDIVFDHVSFKYDLDSPEYTLNDICMSVPKGKITAVVGASGSGKSTLLKLILGYYPPLSGTIDIAGVDIREYNPRWWRSQCGVVMQNGYIFSESIERNIAADDSEIDRAKLDYAARVANIYDFIQTLPLKYLTKIGNEGLGLSQGQKQRILIARAVYRSPEYIMLDEATNSLDASNERTIVDNLSEFFRGRTVIIIAHRLSTVRNADRIVVLDKGRIVETGNHDTLVQSRGVYFNLVKDQLELGH